MHACIYVSTVPGSHSLTHSSYGHAHGHCFLRASAMCMRRNDAPNITSPVRLHFSVWQQCASFDMEPTRSINNHNLPSPSQFPSRRYLDPILLSSLCPLFLPCLCHYARPNPSLQPHLFNSARNQVNPAPNRTNSLEMNLKHSLLTPASCLPIRFILLGA